MVAISVGNENNLAITADGGLWSWGINWNGQLGIGVFQQPSHYGLPPTPDSFRASPVRILEDVSAVSAGSGHSVAIRTDGSLWAWGMGTQGQFGVGTTRQLLTPTRLMDGIIAAYAGDFMTLLVMEDGSLWATGSSWGGIGDGTTEQRLHPVLIKEQVLLP